jgi:diguanylate cyclase
MKKHTEIETENFILKGKIIELENLLREQVIIARQNKKIADLDYLTQISNRMSFTRAIHDLKADFDEKNYPFTLIYVDLDNFKNINDTLGHNEGDVVLIEIANKLVIENRAQTIVGRLGGEEFGLLIPGLTDCEAVVIAERIRSMIENLIFGTVGLSVTASIGMYCPKKEDTADDIIYKADKAMYHSKNTGKNKVTLYKDISKDLA